MNPPAEFTPATGDARFGAAAIAADLLAVRERAPLVHNVTNFVVMHQTANALLAIGASPIMAHAEAELDELLQLAGALVLNIGTLDPAWIAAMEHALAAARRRALPTVLDPVGAGASRLRTGTALRLLASGGVTILRANASEILALAGAAGATKGVDSTHTSEAARDAARGLAVRYGCAVVVSGMVLWTFDDLLIIDVTLYSSALFLEFISLIALRRRAPEAPRPFRIPLNVTGLVVMTAVPALCLGAALYGLFSTANIYSSASLFAIASILTGPVAWWIIQRRFPST